MIHEHWVHVGRDADGEVYVSEGVDLEGMREVRLGDGRRERFRPDGPIPWLDTLTHWTVAPSEITYVTEEGEPAYPPQTLRWQAAALPPDEVVERVVSFAEPPPPWQHIGVPAGREWAETLRLAREHVERRDADA